MVLPKTTVCQCHNHGLEHAGTGEAVPTAGLLSLSAQQAALWPPGAGQGTTAAALAEAAPHGGVGGSPE